MCTYVSERRRGIYTCRVDGKSRARGRLTTADYCGRKTKTEQKRETTNAKTKTESQNNRFEKRHVHVWENFGSVHNTPPSSLLLPMALLVVCVCVSSVRDTSNKYFGAISIFIKRDRRRGRRRRYHAARRESASYSEAKGVWGRWCPLSTRWRWLACSCRSNRRGGAL